jgi:hypothetical protein
VEAAVPEPDAGELVAVEPRYFSNPAAAYAARADLTRQGYACQLLPAWALLAVGPAPGAPPPHAVPLPIPPPPPPAPEPPPPAPPEPDPPAAGLRLVAP